MRVLLFILYTVVFIPIAANRSKKDPRDYTDADFERLYDEWERNDEVQLEEDELPPYKRSKKPQSVDELLKKSNSPEDLMKYTKKGETVLMFVGFSDYNRKKAERERTERLTQLYQSSLYNNHIETKTYIIADNRAMFLFADGSQAWEAKDFLVKQESISEVVLEGKTYQGHGSQQKVDL